MEEKQKEILENAHRIFTKHGIRCVSMDDISSEMGISKKTLYQYFKNKADLLQSVLKMMNARGQMMEEKFRNEKLNAIDTLIEVSKYLNEKMKEAHPIVSFELKKYYPEIYAEQLEHTRSNTFEHVRQNLEQGIREGLYRSEMDVELVASLYIKDIENMLDHDFYCPKQFSFTKIFEAMFEKYIRGIANEKGISYFEEKKEEILKMLEKE